MPALFGNLTHVIERLTNPELPKPLKALLEEDTGAFLLGSTAPDVQTLTHDSRASTHFYETRGSREFWGWEKMIRTNPNVTQSNLSMSFLRAWGFL